MEIDIEQRRSLQEANQNKTDAETFLQQTQDQSQRRLILSYVFFQILLGPVGDALWNARPKMRRYLQRVNCHFIRALCAPSVLSCGSCRMVMESNHLHIYCHFLISRDLCWRAFGTEHACESPRHGSQQACLPCTLCFLSLWALKT